MTVFIGYGGVPPEAIVEPEMPQGAEDVAIPETPIGAVDV